MESAIMHGTPSITPLGEGPSIIVDIEDFQYTYRCSHCGHEWSEKHQVEFTQKSELAHERSNQVLSADYFFATRTIRTFVHPPMSPSRSWTSRRLRMFLVAFSHSLLMSASSCPPMATG